MSHVSFKSCQFCISGILKFGMREARIISPCSSIQILIASNAMADLYLIKYNSPACRATFWSSAQKSVSQYILWKLKACSIYASIQYMYFTRHHLFPAQCMCTKRLNQVTLITWCTCHSKSFALRMIIFGGCSDQGKWLSDVYTLDLLSWRWDKQATEGLVSLRLLSI